MRKVENPKLFPHWNSVQDFSVPVATDVLLCVPLGPTTYYLKAAYVHDIRYMPPEVTHWMYSPASPQPVPQRGVWVKIEDGLPPINEQVLVKDLRHNLLRLTFLTKDRQWNLAFYGEIDRQLDLFTHWYWPPREPNDR